jgi:hypothetical protein
MPDTICTLVGSVGVEQYLNGETRVLACWSCNGLRSGVQLLRIDGTSPAPNCLGTRGGYLIDVEVAERNLRPDGYEPSAHDVLSEMRGSTFYRRVPVRVAMQEFLLSVEADVHRIVYARTGTDPVNHAAAPVIVAARLRAGYTIANVPITGEQRNQLVNALQELSTVYAAIVGPDETEQPDSLYDTLNQIESLNQI